VIAKRRDITYSFYLPGDMLATTQSARVPRDCANLDLPTVKEITTRGSRPAPAISMKWQNGP